MAKTKRRLKAGGPADTATTPIHDGNDGLPQWVRYSRGFAAAFLGGMLVYGAYFPSDSILVEQGDALWFCALALVTLTLTVVSEPMIRCVNSKGDSTRPGISRFLGTGVVLDLMIWNLALWIMIAAFATSPPGNLRMATNEAWLWIAGAAVVTSARRLLAEDRTRAMVLTLILATSAGLAAHAMHQEKISLPEMRAKFTADPDRMLREAGIDAPRLSSRRMVFTSRLMDGGPTATYALANSLAAALMASVLIPIGILRRGIALNQTKWMLFFWAMVICLGVAAIIATRSRSALLAVMAGVVFWFTQNLFQEASQSGGGSRRRLKFGMRFAIGLGMVAMLIGGGVALFGDDEWMAAAPASLEFRLQYWKATLRMLTDHPWMGAGPGGFQSMYLQYRLPIADETIADPHNFFFETLGAGGFVAGGLLLVIMGVTYRESKRCAVELSQPMSSAEPTKPVAGGRADSATAVLGGAVIAFGLIWLLGLAANHLPDVPASLLAVPVAMLTAWFAGRTLANMNAREHRTIAGALLTAILVHLLVSGGWTVPGIALLIWVSASMLVPTSKSANGSFPTESNSVDSVHALSRARQFATGGFLIGLTLLATLRFVSIGPVQAAHFAQQRAEFAARQGIQSRADEENQRAVDADSWAFEPALWRSEWLLGQLLQRDTPMNARQQWEAMIETAHQRSGRNPRVLRAIGEQYLRLYQRFGQRDDLLAADHWITQTLLANPTDASLTAQAALIAAEKSEWDDFQLLRERAWELSLSAKNLTRHLDVKFVYVVRPIGSAAANRNVMDRASKLMQRREAAAADRSESPPDEAD